MTIFMARRHPETTRLVIWMPPWYSHTISNINIENNYTMTTMTNNNRRISI